MVRFQFEAIGTSWEIDLYEPMTSAREGEILALIRSEIDAFDRVYSRFRPDSIVTQISEKAGRYTFPENADQLFAFYRELYDLTGGLFSPFVGQVLVDAGYDPSYSLTQKKELTPAPDWDENISYNHPFLTVEKPVLFDFGAAGKGYIIDIIGELLETQKITKYCIDAGGDIRHRGDSSLRIGMENPANPTQALGVVSLQNMSICGSAGNRRKWGNYHHIMDPKNGTSPSHILGVWALAGTTLLADGMTTCLYFVEPEVLQKYEFEYCIIYADYTFRKSDKFPGELFIKN